MIRVIIDTSVLVSAVISPSGPNARLLDLIAAGRIRPCVTAAVLDEYARVFQYERLQHLDRKRISRLFGLLEEVALRVKSGGRIRISIHEDDNRIYECAVAAKADYIVTENTKHFTKSYKTARIITARQFLKLLETGRA